MIWASVIDGCTDGCILLVRGVIGFLVGSVLFQGLLSFMPGHSQNRFLVALKELSDRVAAPARVLLPETMQHTPWDAAPLLSALLLLLIGFGFETFLSAISTGLN